eukprot:TRINITY_DN35870_c0_g1_i1.p1 TRINITY_DN35870_c0_g1~~TRINITY_DN35870_c0_g1_i1.p1  ORF type:complete len:364 (+),score=84.46 TRINITY_DN35870_c0_g1_i1:73-1092(+)
MAAHSPPRSGKGGRRKGDKRRGETQEFGGLNGAPPLSLPTSLWDDFDDDDGRTSTAPARPTHDSRLFKKPTRNPKMCQYTVTKGEAEKHLQHLLDVNTGVMNYIIPDFTDINKGWKYSPHKPLVEQVTLFEWDFEESAENKFQYSGCTMRESAVLHADRMGQKGLIKGDAHAIACAARRAWDAIKAIDAYLRVSYTLPGWGVSRRQESEPGRRQQSEPSWRQESEPGTARADDGWASERSDGEQSESCTVKASELTSEGEEIVPPQEETGFGGVDALFAADAPTAPQAQGFGTAAQVADDDTVTTFSTGVGKGAQHGYKGKGYKGKGKGKGKGYKGPGW